MMTRCVSKHVGAIKWTKCFSVLIIYIYVHKLVYENNWIIKMHGATIKVKESWVQIPLTAPLGAGVLLVCIFSSVGKRFRDRPIPPPPRVLKTFQKLIPNRNTPEGTIHKCIKTKGIENVQFMLSYTPTSRHHSKQISSLKHTPTFIFQFLIFLPKCCVAQKVHTLETWSFRFVVKYGNLFTEESECTENFCCIKIPQNRKGKHSDIRYNKHCQSEEQLKKTIMPLT
jgi:hypothetical protein